MVVLDVKSVKEIGDKMRFKKSGAIDSNKSTLNALIGHNIIGVREIGWQLN